MSSDERKFLHDISNPLTIAQGMIDSVGESLDGVEGVDEKVHTRLEKAIKAMERMAEQIRARREILVKSEKDVA